MGQSAVGDPRSTADHRKRPKLRFGHISVLALICLGGIVGISVLAGTLWDWPNRGWWWVGENKDQLTFIGLIIPLGALIVASLVYRRDQWWKRAEWALTAATEDVNYSRRLAGALALEELRTSRFAMMDDVRMIEQIGAQLIDEDIGDESEDVGPRHALEPRGQ